MLLRAVVQVALDLAARGVARRDQPGARGAQLLVARPQLGVEALVAQREPGRRAGGAHELRLLQQRRVVDDRGDAAAVVLDLGDGPWRAGRGQLDGAPVGVDVAAGIRQPVGERELTVAERLGERVADARRPHALDQRADRARPREARAQRPARNANGTAVTHATTRRLATSIAPSAPMACGTRPTALEAATAPPVHATGASARRWTGPERRQRRTSTTTTPTSSTMPAAPSAACTASKAVGLSLTSSRFSGHSGQSSDGWARNSSPSGASSGIA